jgi:hypothetical protein
MDSKKDLKLCNPINRKYVLKQNELEEYPFTLMINENSEYKIRIARMRENETMYECETTWNNINHKPVTSSLSHDINAVGDTVIDSLLNYLTLEIMYYFEKDDNIMIYKIHTRYNIEADNDCTILKYNNDIYALNDIYAPSNFYQECWLYYDDLYAHLSFLTCRRAGCIDRFVDIGHRNTEVTALILEVHRLFNGYSPFYHHVYLLVVDKLVNYYYPKILKNVEDSEILLDPLRRIVAEYCICKP